MPDVAHKDILTRLRSESHPMLLNGESVDSISGETFDVFDPGTGEAIANVARGAEPDVQRAIEAARASFEDQRWRAIPAQERGRILWRVAELIETRADELAVVESLNQGQPVGQTRWLMAFAADCFRYYAGWVDKLHGITAELLVGTTALHGYTLREPMGVAALIVPWNAPMLTATAKIAAALTAGCSCVLKPAEETPLTALLLGQILAEAGVPPGVVNIVTGFGDAGAALSDHPDIDKISFTGSTEVGKLIIKAAAGNLKKVTLELGGKSPFIVFADADLAEAIPAAARSIFGNTGQGCTVGSRLFVHESHLDEVIQGVAKLASEIRVGYSMDPAAEIGPLISDKQLKTVTGYVESAVTDGANVVVGGNRIGDTGFYFQPTVLTKVDNKMRAVREEIFGPVLAVMPFRETDEAIELANDTTYGLAASVWSKDGAFAQSIVRRLRAGRVGVNIHAPGPLQMPTGGYRQSGWGREQGPEGVSEYLEVKSVMTALSAH